MGKFIAPTFAVLLSLFATNVLAQNPSGANRGKSKGASLSIQGKQLPGVTVFDESGEKVILTEALKGRHVVIVFGCLT